MRAFDKPRILYHVHNIPESSASGHYLRLRSCAYADGIHDHRWRNSRPSPAKRPTLVAGLKTRIVNIVNIALLLVAHMAIRTTE